MKPIKRENVDGEKSVAHTERARDDLNGTI